MYHLYFDLTVQSSLPLHPLAQRSLIGRLWVWVAYSMVRAFFALCCRVQVQGHDAIPRHGGVLLAGNHISAFDTLLLPYTVMAMQGMQVIWAPAKAELFRNRILSGLLTSLGVFPVRRGQHDRQAMRRMIAYMRTDKLMLFPEGTRSQDGQLQEGKRTVGKLIYAARPVVIPVAIRGTEAILSSLRRPWRGRAPVLIRYGPPVDLQPYYALKDTKETAIAIVQEVMSAIATLLHQAPQKGTADGSCPLKH